MADHESIQKMIASLMAEDASTEEAIRKLTAHRSRLQAALTPLIALVAPPADEPDEFVGKLAEACRIVLKKSGRPLTPLEVRDEVKALGYDLTKHKNEMAAIHSVLKRMDEAKEPKDVKRHDLKDGSRYSWIGPPIPVRSVREGFANIGTGNLGVNSFGQLFSKYDYSAIREVDLIGPSLGERLNVALGATSPAAMAALEQQSKIAADIARQGSAAMKALDALKRK